MFRRRESQLEVLLVHPGGPFWAKKDEGAWSIPKGELADGEAPLAAAQRECGEELGVQAAGVFLPLGSLKQSGGKTVHAWAVDFDFDPSGLKSNTFSLEWPPKSGRMREFPEVDRAEWFSIETAHGKILKSQAPFLDRLAGATGYTGRITNALM